MIARRTLLAVAALACTALPFATVATPARAETITYSADGFDAALKTGRPILVEVHAPWCPTCKAQAPILSSIEATPKFKDLLVVHVDFDQQKDALRRFKVQMQSTLITFKAGKETGRSVGDTDPKSIAALLDKAI